MSATRPPGHEQPRHPPREADRETEGDGPERRDDRRGMIEDAQVKLALAERVHIREPGDPHDQEDDRKIGQEERDGPA